MNLIRVILLLVFVEIHCRSTASGVARNTWACRQTPRSSTPDRTSMRSWPKRRSKTLPTSRTIGFFQCCGRIETDKIKDLMRRRRRNSSTSSLRLSPTYSWNYIRAALFKQGNRLVSSKWVELESVTKPEIRGNQGYSYQFRLHRRRAHQGRWPYNNASLTLI